MSIIDIFYNNRKQTIEILNTGGKIMKYLGIPNDICPLLNDGQIQIRSQLGRSANAIVFDLYIKDFDYGRYAVKIPKKTVDPESYQECLTTMDESFRDLGKRSNIIIIPKDSYLCENGVISEYLIGLLIGNLYR